MRPLAILILLLAAVAGAARAGDNAAFIEGTGVLEPGGRTNPCPGSTLWPNHDGSIENAFTWYSVGVVAPDYGSLAEGYPEAECACGVQLWLTRWGTHSGTGIIDLFVWDYDAGTGNPGSVLTVTANVPVSGVPMWPNVAAMDFDIEDALSYGLFVGYWPRSFAGQGAQFGCAIDQDGPGGVPRTNIAPGIGYPTGWNNPSVAGYYVAAFGINPYIGGGVISGCNPPDPPAGIEDIERDETRATTWGHVKQLYR